MLVYIHIISVTNLMSVRNDRCNKDHECNKTV